MEIESGRPRAQCSSNQDLCCRDRTNVFRINAKTIAELAVSLLRKERLKRALVVFGFDGDGDNPRRWDNLPILNFFFSMLQGL